MPAFLGTNAAHISSGVSEMPERARSPVPGTSILSLSGHPLGSSLEIAKAPGPADVCGPWSFVSGRGRGAAPRPGPGQAGSVNTNRLKWSKLLV